MGTIMRGRGPLRTPVWVVWLVIVGTALLGPANARAQPASAASLAGTARDRAGTPVPGVVVTVSSESLIGTSRSVTTDGRGAYRVAGLPPGLYLVVMTADGMKPVMRNATLDPGMVLTLDATMVRGPASEVVAVIGDGPMIETRNPSTPAYLREELLAPMPVSPRFGPEPITYTPGVDPRGLGAYGTAGPGEHAWLADGADISDPRSGDRVVDLAHAWLAGVRVSGLGAGVEAGNFTGIAIDRTLRAGGNLFRGTATLTVQEGWLTAGNLTNKLAAATPRLTAPRGGAGVEADVNAGGALQRDRVWLFGGFQATDDRRTPAGFDAAPPAGYPPAARAPDDVRVQSPRMLVKPTVRLGDAAIVSGFFLVQGLDRDGIGGGLGSAPGATLRLESSARAWNARYTRRLPRMSLLDVQYSGADRTHTLAPYNGQMPGWYDVARDYHAVNGVRQEDGDSGRQTMAARLTLFRSLGPGEHEFTIGGGVTAGRATTTAGVPGGTTVLASSGRPFATLRWDGASFDDRTETTSLWAEDRWLIAPRVTITPGLRLDVHRGRTRPGGDAVFATAPWSPRAGIAWDVAGDGRTVVRARAGILHDALRTSFFERAGSGLSPVYRTFVAADLTPVSPPVVIDPGGNRRIDNDVRQPRTRELVLGAEREVLRGIFISASAVWRTSDRFLDDVGEAPLREFLPIIEPDAGPDDIPGTGDETDRAFTLYLQPPGAAASVFRITNPEGAVRKYRALQIAGRKRMANDWQVQGSWVVSRLTGTYEPALDGGVTPAYDSPNTDPALQPFLDGRLAADLTHIVSAVGSYTLPYGVLVSGGYRFVSGAPFERTVLRFLSSGPTDLAIEPRGTERLSGSSQVDVRVQRVLDIPNGDLVIGVEVFNLTNGAAVLDRVTRSGAAFFEPRALASPRTIRLGAVWRF